VIRIKSTSTSLMNSRLLQELTIANEVLLSLLLGLSPACYCQSVLTSVISSSIAIPKCTSKFEQVENRVSEAYEMVAVVLLALGWIDGHAHFFFLGVMAGAQPAQQLLPSI
jgi:hypothetical protein